ncbi:MAG: alpha/beta hydrolase [Cellulomonadaceae bacterium]|jgi:pimeloyl-ACP methyl ester carboxylesterase|nr:alpha/beta hydrolase [Cellulomonadaceae bacterium]
MTKLVQLVHLVKSQWRAGLQFSAQARYDGVVNQGATDYSVALVEGPWEHAFVSANGHRFHLVLAGPTGVAQGKAPLLVLLHDFGQFWWAWRSVIPPLAEAGYRVAALDLRGVGASDKPPGGYDVPTRTRDVAAVIRSLGYNGAVVVGHGTGGEIAWAMAALQPDLTTVVAALACPHPARLHLGFTKTLTPQARRLFAFAQIPTIPEHYLLHKNKLAAILNLGAARPFSDASLEKYQEVMRIPFAAHNSVEAIRWLVRSAPRPDGHRYRTALQNPLDIPVLQLHGDKDGFVRIAGAAVDAAVLCRNFTYQQFAGVGHYLPEEAPALVVEALLDWLNQHA